MASSGVTYPRHSKNPLARIGMVLLCVLTISVRSSVNLLSSVKLVKLAAGKARMAVSESI